MTDKIHYSWQELQEDVSKIAQEILDSDWRPQEIIGILRGGAIPGIMLSHLLDIPFRPIQWSTRDHIRQDVASWKEVTTKAGRGEKFLLVDDIIDSGKTLSDMIKRGKGNTYMNWQDNLKIAVLWRNTAQPVSATFVGREIDKSVNNSWIVFPYEVDE